MTIPILEFCPIDAKCGCYMPVQLSTGDGSAYSEENAAILSEINQKYLDRLADLQQEMRAEYEVKLVNEPNMPHEDQDPFDIIITNRKEVDHLFYT